MDLSHKTHHFLTCTTPLQVNLNLNALESAFKPKSLRFVASLQDMLKYRHAAHIWFGNSRISAQKMQDPELLNPDIKCKKDWVGESEFISYLPIYQLLQASLEKRKWVLWTASSEKWKWRWRDSCARAEVVGGGSKFKMQQVLMTGLF